ncbi:MAG: hypothetical protein AAFR21_15750, partial [Pseudomonadota bacterium]
MPAPSTFLGGGTPAPPPGGGGGGSAPIGTLTASALRNISHEAGLPRIFGDTISGDASPDLHMALLEHITSGGGDFLIAGNYE